MNDIYTSPKSEVDPSATPGQGRNTQKPLSIVWVVLGFIMMFGGHSSVLVQVAAGIQPQGASVGSAIFWTSVFFFTVFKYRQKNPLLGLVTGAVAGVILVRLLSYIFVYFA